jgi:putative aminopeptidase FrvX
VSPLPEGLRALLTAPGASGRERTAAGVWQEAARAFTDDVGSDLVGSSTARVPGTVAGAPRLAVVGHIDEIGLMVSHIDDDGFLWFGGVGGWDPVNLVGQRVELHTKDGVVLGVVGKKPIHLLESEEREKAPKLKDLHIDIGAKDRDEAKGRVRVGDWAVVAGEPVELAPGRVASRAMDNRLGCWVALEAARLVAEAGGAPGEVVACAVAQEETTFGGATTTAYAVEPDVAIVVDVTHATDAPSIDKRQEGDHGLGSGPTINAGSLMHPAVVELLRDTAAAEGIAYGEEAAPRSSYTDADAFHLSRRGVPSGVVSIPLRYMHSPVEVVQLSDVEDCAKLIAAFAQRLSAETSFMR